MTSGYEYTGVIHCHSDFSDGRASVDEILAVANRAKLDFLILTDHNSMEAKEYYPTGRYGDVLLIHGVEVTPRYNHYLALGTDSWPEPDQRPQEMINQVRDLGGIGIVCHPHDTGSAFLFHPSYEWLDLDVQGMDGVEIWSFMSQWVAYCQGLFRTLHGLFRPTQAFLGPAPATLAWWDQLCQRQKTVGIGAVDAHALRTWILGLQMTVLPLRPAFSSVRTNLWSEETLSERSPVAAAQVIEKIGSGNVYVADYSGDFQGGFRFWGEHQDSRVEMGAETNFDQSLVLKASWPLKATLKVMQDGALMRQLTGTRWEWRVENPGVYRLEVWPEKGKKPWLLSNPIYVRGS